MGIFSKKNDDISFLLSDMEDEVVKFGIGNPNLQKTVPNHALTADEITSADVDAKPTAESSPLEALRKKILQNSDTEETAQPKEKVSEKKKEETQEKPEENNEEVKKPKSLLERCMPYIIDDEGNNAAEEAPAYTLESVSDILSSENTKAIEKLAKKYEITFDDLGKYSSILGSAPQSEQQPESVVEEKPEVKEEGSLKETTEELSISEITEIQTSLPDISDIDNIISPKEPERENDISTTGTIRFTPVHIDDEITRISVSSQTRPIDLTGELSQIPNTPLVSNQENEMRLEQNEFEDYEPEEEYTCEADAKRLLRKLSIKKRRSFFRLSGSIMLTILTALFLIPPFSDLVLSNPVVATVICAVFMLITILANCDIFKSLHKLFSRNSNPDSTLSLAVLAAVAYVVTEIINEHSAIQIILLCQILLCFRTIGQFIYRSQLVSNFRQILSPMPKNAVKLIDNPAVTHAMARDAVYGDALIAAPQKTGFISDFMKHSTFGVFLSGKLGVINIFATILAVAVAVLAFVFYSGASYAFYGATVILSIACIPCVFLIDSLPLYSAAKKLNNKGAMIAGRTGAEKLEMANAVVLNSVDIFPSGTVTLHNLSVLSENNIDDTLVCAASLTHAMKSPLENIFKRIAGTGNITELPASDTIKYEERMGISGWVNDKLLFIGNRTLMEAHGIAVPSVETDRKILRQGYFPVYVASDNKACALLMIQYSVNPEVAHQLKRLTGAGITVLVNNCDPNLSEEMICDYLGLYDDMVKVMSVAGCNMYKNTIRTENATSASAMFKANPTALLSIINCAGRIKKSNAILSVLYIITAVFGAAVFAYTAFSPSGSLLSGGSVLIYSLASTILSYILYLIQKP